MRNQTGKPAENAVGVVGCKRSLRAVLVEVAMHKNPVFDNDEVKRWIFVPHAFVGFVLIHERSIRDWVGHLVSNGG